MEQSSSRPLSVLYAAFDTVPSPKGASTHITQFIDALCSRYRDTTLLTIGGTHSETGTYRGARHIQVSLKEENLIRRVELFREFISRHLEENRYHVVQFRSIWEGIPILAKKEHGRYITIYEVNGLPSIELQYHYPALKKGGRELVGKLKAQEHWSFTQSDALVTPSPVTAHLLEDAGISRQKIHIIPNGVDTALFHPCTSQDSREVFTILYQGTLVSWQGLDTLLKAFRIVLQQHRARLVILGPGKKSWLKEYRKMVKKLSIESSVHFLPPVPHQEVPGLIQDADICVAPLDTSRRNLLQGCNPIKIYEYMACRKPVVASDIPVIREILEPGVDALLYRPGSADECARCITELIDRSELRENLARHAYEKAVTRYPWSRSRLKLLQLYETLLTGRMPEH